MPVVTTFGLMMCVEVFTLAPPLMLGTMIKFVEDGGTRVEVGVTFFNLAFVIFTFTFATL